MNTPERNQKNVDKMKKLGKVYEDATESQLRENNNALENATREYPLPTVRKFAWVACGGFWVFIFFGLLFGVDLRALFPFVFFSLAFLAGVHIPMFYVKRKIFDVIIAGIAVLSCASMAVYTLVR